VSLAPDPARGMTDPAPISSGLTPEEGLEAHPLPLQPRIDTSRRGLRELAARGVLVNTAFQVGFAALGLAQRFAIAAFLTLSQFGLWGIVLTLVGTLGWLKEIGISAKYVQQDEADQELAFQKAFTLELLYTAIFSVFVLLTLPFFALFYDNWDVVLPAAVLTLTLVGGALQAPIWVSFRSMRFVRQRTLEAINPVLSTAVMVPLAAAGAGHWSIVIGLVVGSFAAAAVAIATSPYPLRFRYERSALSEYVGFSGPLMLSGLAGIVIVQGTFIVGNYTVGLVGLGALTLAASLLAFTERVDQLISRTIYPAICAVATQRELLREAFEKSNRLNLMWAIPFGFGIALFGGDLVEFVLGDRWEPAVALLQTLGITSALRQAGFNWGWFFNAIGETKPLAVSGGVLVAIFATVTLPAMIAWGLDGFIVGTAASLIAELAIRSVYLRRIFAGFSLLPLLLRSLAPVLPAAGTVLALRLALGAERGLEIALLELAAFIAITLCASVLLERRLLSEIGGYLRGGGRDPLLPRRGDARMG